jgi:hypothetical protein
MRPIGEEKNSNHKNQKNAYVLRGQISENKSSKTFTRKKKKLYITPLHVALEPIRQQKRKTFFLHWTNKGEFHLIVEEEPPAYPTESLSHHQQPLDRGLAQIARAM